MPNIKSAKKRVLVNRTKAQRNKSRNSALKTAIKKANAAIDGSTTFRPAGAVSDGNSMVGDRRTQH